MRFVNISNTVPHSIILVHISGCWKYKRVEYICCRFCQSFNPKHNIPAGFKTLLWFTVHNPKSVWCSRNWNKCQTRWWPLLYKFNRKKNNNKQKNMWDRSGAVRVSTLYCGYAAVDGAWIVRLLSRNSQRSVQGRISISCSKFGLFPFAVSILLVYLIPALHLSSYTQFYSILDWQT